MVIPLQASKSRSRSQEEEEEEESSETTLDNIVDSKEVVCAFNSGSFTEMGIPSLFISVSSDSIFRGVRVLNVQVGQDESRKSS